MGFYPAEENKKAPKEKPAAKTPCELCGRCNAVGATKTRFVGEGKKGILIVGSYLTMEESTTDMLGKNEGMKHLRYALSGIGIDLFEDCYYTTAVNCAGKTPTSKEAGYCVPRLLSVIKNLKPKSIILLGETPFHSLIYPKISGRLTGTPWTDFVGFTVPDQEYKTFITTVWHPDYLLETKKYSDNYVSPPLYKRDPSVMKMWQNHLRTACNPQAFYEASYDDHCIELHSEKEAIEILDKACSWDKAAFDYETTGIKPQRKGHTITDMSLSDGMFSYSFPFFKSEAFTAAVKRFLLSNCRKISHNLQFEAIWTRVLLGYWPKNWFWDTMLGQHCLHNQAGVGLKLLTYLTFGIIGYDDYIDPYIKSSEAEELKYGNNAFNDMLNPDIDETKRLHYNALDSLFTFKLYEHQEGLLDDFMMRGFKFFVKTAQTLAKTSFNGVSVNMAQLEKQKAELKLQVDSLAATIMQSEDVKKWDGEEAFNPDAPQQLAHLLFDIMKIKPKAYTEGADPIPSVDKNNLPKYKIPLIDAIIEYREVAKVYSTYILQYEREVVDGKVYPWFYLHRVKTHRTGAGNPNIQNTPKRDEDTKQIVRSFITASLGRKLKEYDFSGLEVVIAACHHHDPNMISYIMDESKDFHSEVAMDMFILKPEQMTKKIRRAIKGDGTFAMQYGSYYVVMSVNLWEDAKELGLMGHFKSVGLDNYKKFEKHVQQVEIDFWEKRFLKYAEWRKWVFNTYKQRGFIEQFSGFRCYGPMSRNNTFNSPPQGDAAHVLLLLQNYLQDQIEARGWHTSIIAEIHDSLLLDLVPEEEEKIDYLVWDFITHRIPKIWPWVDVPLTMKCESSSIDGTWADMGDEVKLSFTEE